MEKLFMERGPPPQRRERNMREGAEEGEEEDEDGDDPLRSRFRKVFFLIIF